MSAVTTPTPADTSEIERHRREIEAHSITTTALMTVALDRVRPVANEPILTAALLEIALDRFLANHDRLAALGLIANAYSAAVMRAQEAAYEIRIREGIDRQPER